MLCVDCETSGVDTEKDRIVTIACWFIGGGQQPSGFEELLNPGVEIAEEATKVHGITTEHAREHGANPAEVLPAVGNLFADAIKQGYASVIFNARFDLTLIHREMIRHNVAVPDRYPGYVVDPLVLDKHTDPFRRGSRKLEAQVKHHVVKLEGAAHGATADAQAAARLAYRIAKHGEIKRKARNEEEVAERIQLQQEWEEIRVDLPRLHAAQVIYAAEQARGLAKYFESRGQAHDVRPDWPLIPLPEGTDGD